MNAELESTIAMPEAEPTSALTPVPVWLFMATLLAFLFAAVSFDRSGGWFFAANLYPPFRSPEEVAAVQPPKEGDPTVRGKVVFEATCALCHQVDGKGKPGQFPPLAGSDWVNAAGVNRVIRIPLYGLTGPLKVSGQDWNVSMTALGGSLSDADIAAALSYARNAWGNKAPFVTPDQVKKIRAEVGNRMQPYTADELLKLPEELK